jgi:serine/threonine protein kinase
LQERNELQATRLGLKHLYRRLTFRKVRDIVHKLTQAMDARNQEDMECPAIIVDVHDDFQFISLPLELVPPQLSQGECLTTSQGIILRSEHGAFYHIGKKKNHEDLKFGTAYEGRELLHEEETNNFRLLNADNKTPDLHIQIVHLGKYWEYKTKVAQGTVDQKCDDIMDELSILQFIQQFPQHPNIARLVDCLQDKTFLYVVMEYGGDDLYNIITLAGGLHTHDHKDYPGGLYTEAHRRFMFSQILDAVEFLQSIGIYHRDISADNVLFNPYTGVIKIIDFGMSVHIPRMSMAQIEEEMMDRNLQNVNPYPLRYPTAVAGQLVPLLILHQGWYGKKAYFPPEMYASQPINGILADNWSLGVLLYFMLTGRQPWVTPQVDIDKYAKSILMDDQLIAILSAATSVSAAGMDLLRRMLRSSVDPDTRLQIHEIRSHHWMTE